MHVSTSTGGRKIVFKCNENLILLLTDFFISFHLHVLQIFKDANLKKKMSLRRTLEKKTRIDSSMHLLEAFTLLLLLDIWAEQPYISALLSRTEEWN